MKYNIIYADPPWQYDQTNVQGSAERHYKTMSVEELKNMRPYIDTIAAPDCALFIWGTWPMNNVIHPVITAWGFEYKTCAFVWKKETANGKLFQGPGWLTAGNTEYMLFAKRGSIRRVRHMSEFISARIEEHSRKPRIFRDRIVQLMGDRPRIELFARKRAHGWDSMGDDKRLDDEPLEKFL